MQILDRGIFENWQNKISNFYNIIFRTNNFAKFANKNSYLLVVVGKKVLIRILVGGKCTTIRFEWRDQCKGVIGSNKFGTTSFPPTT